jgi:hypothetical protein
MCEPHRMSFTENLINLDDPFVSHLTGNFTARQHFVAHMKVFDFTKTLKVFMPQIMIVSPSKQFDLFVFHLV